MSADTPTDTRTDACVDTTAPLNGERQVRAYAATEPGAALAPFSYTLPVLAAGEVDVRVRYCGVCHSDLSMIDNAWQYSQYPLVPGHEVLGEVVAVGEGVSHLPIGQAVGLGWHSAYCGSCAVCDSGDHNLCRRAEETIAGRHGGFADTVRASAEALVALPEGLLKPDIAPLLCGGITVYNPLREYGVKAGDRVGVVGIGGLGHIALVFLKAMGCELVAFSSSTAKAEEAKRLGADVVLDSTDKNAIKQAAGSLDMLLSTVNVKLDWNRYLTCLKPRGRLHFVGMSLEPLQINIAYLMDGQKSVSASPVGSPARIAEMLDFAAAEQLGAEVECFPMSELNVALDRLRAGDIHYRAVLVADFDENWEGG